MDMMRKCKSQRGATLIFALFGFMVAAMVCVTIVSAAASNANRVKNQTEEEKAYLAVSSAANVVISSMEHLEIAYTEETDGDGNLVKVLKTAEETGYGDAGSNLKTAIQKAAHLALDDGSETSKEIKLEVAGSADTTVSFSAKSDHTLTVAINSPTNLDYNMKLIYKSRDDGEGVVTWPENRMTVIKGK